MLSKTSQYALRALVFLAEHRDEWPIPGPRIAREAGVPTKYLSKILGDLVRAGVLESVRGIGGGFRFADPPEELPLLRVLQSFEPFLLDERVCPFTSAQCTDDDPCVGHSGWKHVRQTVQRFLTDTTLAQVAGQKKKKKFVVH